MPEIDDTHKDTHTHVRVHGLEKSVSENEAPGPVGAYTTTHNDTTTLMPNLIHRISLSLSLSLSLTHTHTHTHTLSSRRREKRKTC